MNKSQVIIFFDDVIREYANYYGKEYEKKLVSDLKKYFLSLFQSSIITVITYQDATEIKIWFTQNGLIDFINEIKSY